MATAGKGKRLVYVSEELLERVAKVTRDEGVSLSKLVEGALAETVKVNELGYASKDMAEFFNVLQTNRVLGGLFIPSGVLDFMVEKCTKKDSKELQTLWFESGMWSGKYLKEKFPNPTDSFGHFLKLTRWDLNEVDVKEGGDSVKVRCISTVMSIEGTMLLAKFIEGVVNGLGYRTEHVDCLKGMIILESKKL
ncbi:MAG: hypothetical protein NWF00_04310 [Candidatus Bathyarchaeota archaeon]|nr:hypothetical protein [Candidatus Bathyarchaeota archaeon]